MLFPKEFGGQFSNPQGAQGVPGAGAMESRVPSALASTCCVVGFPPSLPSCQLFRISLSPLLRKWPGLPPQKSPLNAPRKPPRCSLSPLSTRRFCRSPPCIVTVTSPFAPPPIELPEGRGGVLSCVHPQCFTQLLAPVWARAQQVYFKWVSGLCSQGAH